MVALRQGVPLYSQYAQASQVLELKACLATAGEPAASPYQFL